MSTLMVLAFPTADAAQHMESRLLHLHQQHVISVQDAALVTWPRGARQPKTEQLRSLGGDNALAGTFWGLLFGLIFSVSYLGQEVDVALATLSTKFGDYGIDANLVQQSRACITEGTSALFVLTQIAVVDKATAVMQGQSGAIIAMNLPPAKEDELRCIFGMEASASSGATA